jgi:DNA polymerase-3 subunit alpha
MINESYLKEIQEYCDGMLLDAKIYNQKGDTIISISNIEYKILDKTEPIFVDDDAEFAPEIKYNAHGFFYGLGGRFYTHIAGEEFALNEAKYYGQAVQDTPTNTFLGVRSGMEIMNGLELYDKWIEKAKFLGIKNLAICEKNALSGVLAFQKECKKNDIKPIIGMTVTVNNEFDVKLYVKNFQGWQNLLKFNSKINVSHEVVTTEYLGQHCDGLYVVVDPKSMIYEFTPEVVDFYQLDTVKFVNEEKDSWYAENLKNFIMGDIPPIAITDAFYLEQKDHKIREELWKTSKVFDDKTQNQYFKNKDQYFAELESLFKRGNNIANDLFNTAIESETLLAENCNFIYDTSTRHLPSYQMTPDEQLVAKTNEELFMYYIRKYFDEKTFPKDDIQVYIDRLKKEIKVLKDGDVLDYFLVLHDIIKFSKDEKMLTGIGRGSAPGSLVSYLMDITRVDPIKFNLIFERFLNSGRMGSMEKCRAFQINTSAGDFTINEGTIVRILRHEKEMSVFAEELTKEDIILKFE